ncbi:MAG: putative lipopolysaccharide heptosyltransferase III [Chthoniobacterales bacterium]
MLSFRKFFDTATKSHDSLLPTLNSSLPSPSILLIKLRHHGDVLLTTPVARALKAHFSNSQIDFLVYKGTADLLKNNPDLCRAWPLDRQKKGWQKFWHQLQLLWQLRSQKYDCVIHLSDQMQGAFFAKLLGAKKTIGIDYPKRRNFLWRFCFTHLVPLFESNTRHTVEQNLMTLEPLGIKAKGEEAQCRLVISNRDKEAVKKILISSGITKPYLLVHPASRWFFKCWEDDRFAQVIQYFADHDWPIVITSAPDPNEIKLVDSILKKITSYNILSLAGQLTLPELAAIIDDARLFLGVDSVPMHMAAALQKDVVALFGPSKVNEWRPWITRYRLIDARDYGPLLNPDSVNTKTTERYLSHIPVEPVIAAIKDLLAS